MEPIGQNNGIKLKLQQVLFVTYRLKSANYLMKQPVLD